MTKQKVEARVSQTVTPTLRLILIGMQPEDQGKAKPGTRARAVAGLTPAGELGRVQLLVRVA